MLSTDGVSSLNNILFEALVVMMFNKVQALSVDRFSTLPYFLKVVIQSCIRVLFSPMTEIGRKYKQSTLIFKERRE